MREPSAETKLRGMRSRVKHLELELLRARGESQSHQRRAQAAEKAAANWEARFDALLRRTPTQDGTASAEVRG